MVFSFVFLFHFPLENGLLASRIEILTRHQSESLKKMGKSVLLFDIVQHNCCAS